MAEALSPGATDGSGGRDCGSFGGGFVRSVGEGPRMTDGGTVCDARMGAIGFDACATVS